MESLHAGASPAETVLGPIGLGKGLSLVYSLTKNLINFYLILIKLYMWKISILESDKCHSDDD